MINKFGATCAACGQSVAPGAGDTNKVGERWVTKHAPTCPPRRPVQLQYAGASLMDDLDGDDFGWTAYDWQEACNPDEGDKG